MMNMKKIFGIVLALVLCLSMVSALAANTMPIVLTKTLNTTVEYTPTVEFTFKAEPYNSGTATKEVSGNDGSTMTYKVYEGVAFEAGNDTATIKYGNGGDKDAVKDTAVTRNITLPTFEAGKEGLYTYKVTETKGDATGVKYDETVYIVDVLVDNAGNVLAVTTNKEGTDETEKEPITFENDFETAPLSIEKIVAGNMGDKTKDFDFFVTIDEDGACKVLPAGTQLTATKHLATGATETVTVDVGAKTPFTLKHGEKLSLSGLPAGVAYVIDEDTTSKNQDGYTTTDSGNTEGDTEEKAIEVTVTNTKEGVTPTGVVLSVAPYIAVLVLAAALVVLMAMKKKKA